MRAKRASIAIGVTIILTLVIATANEYMNYSRFRARPTWHTLANEVTEASVRSPVSRLMLFKPGSESYNEQIIEWMSRMELDPAPFDRVNLNALLSTLSAAQIVTLTGTFASNPDPLVPHIKRKLFSSVQPCLFSTLDDERTMDMFWRATDDVDSNEPIEDSDATVVLGDSYDSQGDPVSHGYDRLSDVNLSNEKFQLDQIPWRIPYSSIADDDLKLRIVSCIARLSPESSKHFPIALLPDRLDEIRNVLRNVEDKENAIMVARISMSESKVSSEARDWLVANIGRLPERQIEYIHTLPIGAVVRRALFNRWLSERNDSRAIATLRQTILDGDDTAADEMARSIVEGADSSLKKDLIVVLARNHTVLGIDRIDEAFTGARPRRELFHSYENYLHSAAMDEYHRVSGHGYLQVGKSFPAKYCTPPKATEIVELRKFIQKYPWFPATDDAQLRLASRLFLNGHFDSAIDELERLMAAEYVDSDAKELVPDAIALVKKAREGKVFIPDAANWYETQFDSHCIDGE